MTLMTDKEIRAALYSGRIVIDPEPEDQAIQPTSVDVHLGNQFKVFTFPADGNATVLDTFFASVPVIDAQAPDIDALMTDFKADTITVPSKGFALGIIAESLLLPSDIACRIEGKSSLGRLGIGVHVTAGFVDPGWNGNLTIEIVNHSPHPIKLTAGMKISQFCFYLLRSHVDRPYGHEDLGSRYQDQNKPGASQGSESNDNNDNEEV